MILYRYGSKTIYTWKANPSIRVGKQLQMKETCQGSKWSESIRNSLLDIRI